MDEYTKTHKYWYPKGAIMNINVSGHRSTKFKTLISQATEYYCSRLLSKKMMSSLDIDIIFKKKLDDDNDFEAFCEYGGKEDGIRYFTIELKKNLSVRDTLTYLAHECVHLKQFALGELKDGTVYALTTRWKGREINEQQVDYWDQPWEIEAYGREKGLYSNFINTRQIKIEKSFLDSII